jgi:hypothetical protein
MLLRSLRTALTEPAHGQTKPAPQAKLQVAHLPSYIPPYWRTEARSPEEWFIRYIRAVGLHGTYDAEKRVLVVRLTRDAADDQSITWPGKNAAPQGPSQTWADTRRENHADNRNSGSAAPPAPEAGPEQRESGEG